MSSMMRATCRSDDGSEDATTVAGSAPQSPCMWQSERENNTHVQAANEPCVVPLNTFFGAPTFSLSTPMAAREQSDETLSPAVIRQSSSVTAVAKDTLLLAELEAKMARKQHQQTQSPCSSIWSSPVAAQASAVVSPNPSPSPLAPKDDQVTRAPTASSCGKPKIPAKPRALVLSPMSQLNVLSQISEMADRQAQLAATPAPAVRSAAGAAQKVRQHVWAPAMESGKKRPISGSITSPSALQTMEATTKKKALGRNEKAAAQQQNQLSVTIAKDMVDWETCSEDIFLGDLGGESEEDTWVFEDISDSDFE